MARTELSEIDQSRPRPPSRVIRITWRQLTEERMAVSVTIASALAMAA